VRAEQESRSASQVSLFGEASATFEGPKLPEVPRWDESDRLQNEKLALGFYYSGHPFRFYEDEFSSVVRTRLSKLLPPAPEEGMRQQLIAGIVESVRMQKTAGGRMMVMMLSDGSARVEVVVYDEVLDRHRSRTGDCVAASHGIRPCRAAEAKTTLTLTHRMTRVVIGLNDRPVVTPACPRVRLHSKAFGVVADR